MHVRALTIATLVCGLLSFPALADKLRITTVPPGATVQINGVLVGITPYEQSIPGGYLHKTKTALGSRLGYPMVARLTLEGYAAKEIQLTEGPMSWVLKTDHFQVELQSASKTFTGAVESVSGSSALVLGPRPELSLEELVGRTKPAVVFLKSLTKSGTGFFITETGVIATNAHLARGEEALLRLCRMALNWKAKSCMSIQTWILRWQKRPAKVFLTFRLRRPRRCDRGKACWPSGIPVMRCFSALPRESSALLGDSTLPGLAPGFKPTHPSTRGTAAGRCLIPAVK